MISKRVTYHDKLTCCAVSRVTVAPDRGAEGDRQLAGGGPGCDVGR